MPNFIEDRSEDTLFVNGSLESLLPETSMARVIWEALSGFDFSRFEARYANDEGGRPAVNPRGLTAVWLLALLRDIASSVKLAVCCAEDIEFRWLLGDAPVEKSTLCDFRRNHLDTLIELSTQVLAALSRSGLLPGEALGTDGSVVRAAASCGASQTRKDLKKKLKRLEKVVEKHLREPDEAPEVREGLIQRTNRVRKALDEMEALGLNADEDRMTITEPDAPMRKLKNGAFAPAHNIQLTSDLTGGAIIHTDVVDQGNDGGQLGPQIAAAEAVLEDVKASLEDEEACPGPVRAVAADSMYHDTRQIVELEGRGVETFVPNRQDSRRPPGVSDAFMPEAFTYDESTNTMCCPEGHPLKRRKLNNDKTAVTYQARTKDCRDCPHKFECCPKAKSGRCVNRPIYGALLNTTAQRLKTPRGKRYRQARSVGVEGAFARLMERLHWRRCRMWGAHGARAEAVWRQLAHNLMLLTGQWQPLVLKASLET